MSPAPATAPSGRSNLDMLLADRLGTMPETKRPSKGRKGSTNSGGSSSSRGGARLADVTPAPINTSRGELNEGTSGSRWASASPSERERSPRSAPPASSRHTPSTESSKKGSARSQKSNRGSRHGKGGASARDASISATTSPRTPASASVEDSFHSMQLSPNREASTSAAPPTISILQSAPTESSGRRGWADEDEDDSFSLAEWGVDLNTAVTSPKSIDTPDTPDQDQSSFRPPAPEAPPVRELFPDAPPTNGHHTNPNTLSQSPQQTHANSGQRTRGHESAPEQTGSIPSGPAPGSTAAASSLPPNTLSSSSATKISSGHSSGNSSTGETPQRRSPRLPEADGKTSVQRVSRLLGGAGLTLKNSPQRGAAETKHAEPSTEQQQQPASQQQQQQQLDESQCSQPANSASSSQGAPNTPTTASATRGAKSQRGQSHKDGRQPSHRDRSAHHHNSRQRTKKPATEDQAQTKQELSSDAAEKPQVRLPNASKAQPAVGSASSRWARA